MEHANTERPFARRHMTTRLHSSLFRTARLSVHLRRVIAPSVSFALFLLTLGSSAEAAPLFTACVPGPQDFLPVCVSGPEPITMRTGFVNRSIGSDRFQGSASINVGTHAESTPLGLKAAAEMVLLATGIGGQAGGGGSGYAAVRYDDFLVNASGVSFVPGSLTLLLSGWLSTGGASTGNGGLIAAAFAGAGVTVGVTVNGTYLEGGAFQGRSPSGVSYSTYGPLTNLTLPAPFTTPVLNFPVGTPFSLLLELTPFVSANAVILGTPEDEFSVADFLIDSFSDFTSTLTFPTSGPVFTLPEGATVNSPSALIVNNRFIGASPSAVPEPSSIFLVALGLFGLRLGRWTSKAVTLEVVPILRTQILLR